MIMADQEPTELTILLRIVEVLERRMLREHQSAPDDATTGYIANVVNNFIASSPNLAFAGSGEAVIMRDKYTTGQAGAVGPGSIAIGQQFQQIWAQEAGSVNLADLVDDLRSLRSHGRSAVTGSAEEDIAMAELAQAEVSAEQGDGAGMMGHLARAGKWSLGLAKELGLEVLANVIAKSMGM
jgi:hypothetical protein